jgi:hypothetical protein
MALYILIGGDQKEYGPIPATDVQQWLTEGRLNEESLIKVEGDADFRPLSTFPEFAGAATSLPPIPPPFGAGPSDSMPEDYELDLGGCLSRGWALVKNNFSVLFVGTLVYLLIEGVIGGLAQVPFVGALFSVVNLVISGPLLAGVFYLFLRVLRSEPAEVGDIFHGFRRAFGQLFLGTLIPSLLVGACLLPFIVLVLWKLTPLMGLMANLHADAMPDPETLATLTSVLLPCLPVLLFCAIPATYLAVCWKFTLPLILDQGLDFWTAMKLSRQRVHQHWWLVFGLLILISLLNFAGLCLCCVGVLFTLPVGYAALMIAYETIFPKGPSA